MYRRKDNLTDLVETVSSTPVKDDDQLSGDQQVVNGDGEVVTLGHKSPAAGPSGNNKSSLELSASEREEMIRTLTDAARVAISKSLDDFFAKVNKSKDK